MAVEMMITTAGLEALVDAQAGVTEAIRVVEVGLTESLFTMAPTITALPGEFKRIDTISGQAVSDTVIHMTGMDSTTDVYALHGIALYLEDGILFAVYGQATPIFRKVSIAAFLLALDVKFAGGGADDIIFGDANFLIPPATESIKGVAMIATQDEVDGGTDDSKIVTPEKLAVRLSALELGASDAIGSAVGAEAEARVEADNGLSASIAAILLRLNGGEFANAPSGNFAGQGHLDFPVMGQVFRLNWGKKDVPAKTATTDLLDAVYTVCWGVFQGGGTTDPNNTDAIRAYPGTGAQATTHVNLTNGTAGLLTIHWIAIGMAA